MQNPNGPPPGGIPPPGAIPMPPMPPGVPPLRPGVPPTPEQLAAIKQMQQQMQQKIAQEAEKAGMTPQEFVQHMQKQQQAMRAQMLARQQQQQQGGGPPGQGQQGQGQPQGPPQQVQGRPGAGQPQPQPITPGPPNPVAIALANFLRTQELKPRTCILNGERKDMFRVKRALRALQSPAYEKARKKNPALPEITDRPTLENAFKLLPMSMLALRVEKIDPHAGHAHPPKRTKRVKGLWTVRIVPQQDAGDDMYYAWMYEGSQVMRKVYAALALIAIFIVVCYPLWPLKMRQGVYYLSWGFLCLLGLFFVMAIFRVILFSVTYFVVSPGLWLFPNLWEDVSFVDSFKPVWAWHEVSKPRCDN
ncbi:hypothetical protein VPNG_01559 [Cytospora leucostoma]|uniref:Translocation protein SEC62 n=1 Tax=Cytospora leucostoma TaxID=1230097 RepID=A0A423XJZ1_9PEZI|nr:hypothetical protein VPNG_01559 [Cytospora leucostoma]